MAAQILLVGLASLITYLAMANPLSVRGGQLQQFGEGRHFSYEPRAVEPNTSLDNVKDDAALWPKCSGNKQDACYENAVKNGLMSKPQIVLKQKDMTVSAWESIEDESLPGRKLKCQAVLSVETDSATVDMYIVAYDAKGVIIGPSPKKQVALKMNPKPQLISTTRVRPPRDNRDPISDVDSVDTAGADATSGVSIDSPATSRTWVGHRSTRRRA